MFKRLFKCFGYVPEQQLIDTSKTFISQLEIKDNEIKSLTEERDKYLAIIPKYKKELKDLRTIIHSHGQNYQSEIDVLQHKVKGRDNVISELKQEVNSLKRKNIRLLKKQGKFKQEIEELQKDLTKQTAKYTFWKIYAEGAVDKLEQLCFGSVLPKIVRALDLSKYQIKQSNINLKWNESQEGLSIRVIDNSEE